MSVKHKNRKAVHGYKAHVACDEGTSLIEKITVTPANVNDGKAGCVIIPDDPGDVYADSAYRGPRFREPIDLGFEITGQIVIFQQDPVLQGLVPTLDLALGLRMVGSASDMLHAPIVEPFSQVAGDVARPIVRQQSRHIDDLRLIAA